MSGNIDFTDLQMDVLREIGSMGTAYAATSISSVLGKKITIDNIKVSWVDFQDTGNFIGGPENIVASVLFRLSGAIEGIIVYTMDLESASTILGAMFGKPVPIDAIYGEMEKSALSELGNIAVCSYVTAMAELLKCQISPSIPFLAIDMANAILSFPVAEFGRLSDQVLFIDTKLAVSNVSNNDSKEAFSGSFFLVPSLESSKELFRILGVN